MSSIKRQHRCVPGRSYPPVRRVLEELHNWWCAAQRSLQSGGDPSADPAGDAMAAAGMAPDQLCLIEPHGPGTPLGAPTEIRSLVRASSAVAAATQVASSGLSAAFTACASIRVGYHLGRGDAGVRSCCSRAVHPRFPGAHDHAERPHVS